MSSKFIRSPCRGVCKIDTTASSCTECKRTIEEIQDWSSYTDEQRTQIMKILKER